MTEAIVALVSANIPSDLTKGEPVSTQVRILKAAQQNFVKLTIKWERLGDPHSSDRSRSSQTSTILSQARTKPSKSDIFRKLKFFLTQTPAFMSDCRFQRLPRPNPRSDSLPSKRSIWCLLRFAPRKIEYSD